MDAPEDGVSTRRPTMNSEVECRGDAISGYIVNSNVQCKPSSSANLTEGSSATRPSSMASEIVAGERFPRTESTTSSPGGSSSSLVARVVSVFRSKRSMSLPVEQTSTTKSPYSFQADATDRTALSIVPNPNLATSHQRPEVSATVTRSLSVPPGIVYVIAGRRSPLPPDPSLTSNKVDNQTEVVQIESGHEEIPEESAVCRICLNGLYEEGNPLKMQCSCKGDLALVHEYCAAKWFSIKGNKICDICGQEVQNLPVTLFRVQNSTHRNGLHQNSGAPQRMSSQRGRNWQDLVGLAPISMLAYFCFLEQLLLTDMGTGALMLALPYSFSIGLFTSIFAYLIAHRDYIWAYAAIQLVAVIILLHLFYSVFHLSAVVAILSSAVGGVGTAMSINSLFMEFWSATAQGN